MKFRIDVYTASGTAPTGSGPITDVLGISISERLNQVGEIQITLPAFEAAQRGLSRGMRYRVYHASLGYLGEFKHIESTIDASAETITIRAYDSLIGLAERVAGFRRNYSNQVFNTLASNLFGTIGWTVSYEGGVTLTDAITYSVEGENYLRMADYLRKYVRGWFRRQGDTEIQFGEFSTTTPTLTFVAAPSITSEIPANQALITQITRTRAGGEVSNRIYPVGAGIGETKLDLRYSNRTTPYTVQSTSIVSGAATAYYIEDSTSITSYGLVERVVAWNEIRPITNSAADLQNAGNALYDIASAYLLKYRNESDAYTLTAVDVPATLRVGDLVRVQYNGVAELENGRVGWLNVASNFFVTEITRSFDDRGEAQTTLSIAANGEAVIGDTEVLYDILADVQTLKLRTQPTQTYLSRSYDTVMMQKNANTSAVFRFTIGSEVLAINELYAEMTVRPIAQPSITASASVTATNAANGIHISGLSVTSTSTSTNFLQLDTTDNTTAVNQTNGGHQHNITVFGGGGGDVVYLNGATWNKASAGNVTPTTDSAGGHIHIQDAHNHKFAHRHIIENQFNHSHDASVTATIGGSTGAFSYANTPRISMKTSFGQITFTSGTGGNTEFFVVDLVGLTQPTIVSVGGISCVDGFAVSRVNITNQVTNLNWRDRSYNIVLENLAPSNACTVHLQVYGRVTIQPIAV
jgi:hypothetical protein